MPTSKGRSAKESAEARASLTERWVGEVATQLKEALDLFEMVQIDRLGKTSSTPTPIKTTIKTRAALFDEVWPFRVLGCDRQGRLVVLDCLGALNFERMAKEMSTEEVMASHAARMEELRTHKLRLYESKGLEAYHQTSIIDLGGLHMGFMRRENRALIQKTMKLMRICYPETVHSIVLINSPAIFPLIWRIVRPWLDPETATKIQVHSGSCKQRLQQLT